jgi:hypothetical protein
MSANFTPVSAVVGGRTIGAPAAIRWLVVGRIAGISGIRGPRLTSASSRLISRIARGKKSQNGCIGTVTFIVG